MRLLHRTSFGALALISGLLVTPARAVQGEPEVVKLTDGGLGVEIRPDTLETTITAKPCGALPVSSALDSTTVSELLADAQHASWKLPERGVSVDVCISSNALELKLVAAKEGTFSWPILRVGGALRGLALPLGEGVYLPADDPHALAVVLERDPMNTTADLSMPFWGLDYGTCTMTYILLNQFNNELLFKPGARGVEGSLTHEFTRNHKVKEYGLRIDVTPSSGPVGSARVYRQWLMDTGKFVSMKDKIARTPEAAKLPGASHIYMWGSSLLAPRNIKNMKALCKELKAASSYTSESLAKRTWELMSEDGRKAVVADAVSQWNEKYLQLGVTDALCAELENRDFFTSQSTSDLKLTTECAALLGRGVQSLSEPELWKLNALLLEAAFPGVFAPYEKWGDGYSTDMMDALKGAGFDRLWVGLDSQKGVRQHAATVARAKELGFLVGPYDSYHSIHSPDLKADATWETAQFDRDLYEKGPVVRADGSKWPGFKKKGFRLSSTAARPYVEKRVAGLMSATPCNSWFMDCDAFGELNDDYSEAHPTTQEEDMEARLGRMAWISNRYGVVMGSEGGSGYAAPVIHFAHGIITPGFGWGDKDLTEKTSPWFLGSYFPPDGPAVFMKAVPLKGKYRTPYFDPTVRVPLYETVFHDSVVVTHQWGFPSLKFKDAQTTVALIEALYQVPPMYHLNMTEFPRIKARMKQTYDFLSPLTRRTALLPVTGYAWLSGDKLVQRTTFGDAIEVTANFSDKMFEDDCGKVPPCSAVARMLDTGERKLYEPAKAGEKQ